MSRLTELIDIDGMKIKTSKERPLSNQGLGEILHKLYKLEDLEDELGCPLEVVFKALKDGIRYFDGKTYTTTSKVNYECLLLDIELKAFRIMTEPMPYSNDTWREYDTLYLKDYGKIWWLKGDRSE